MSHNCYLITPVRDLESDLKAHTTTDFQRLLIAISQGRRGRACDAAVVEAETTALFEAGEGYALVLAPIPRVHVYLESWERTNRHS